MATRKNKSAFTETLQAKFLAAFSNCGSILRSSKLVKISRSDHCNWLKSDKTYPARFEEAKQKAITYLEDIAVQRATEGWEEPVFYQGGECGAIRRYSDTLLIFILKGVAPEKYRERVDNHHSGELTQTIKIFTSGEGKVE